MSGLSSRIMHAPADRDPFSRTGMPPGNPNWNSRKKTGFRTFKEVPFQKSVVGAVVFDQEAEPEPQVTAEWIARYEGLHGVPSKHGYDAEAALNKTGLRRYDDLRPVQSSVVGKVVTDGDGASQLQSQYHRLYDGRHGVKSVKEGVAFHSEFSTAGVKRVDVAKNAYESTQNTSGRAAGYPTGSSSRPNIAVSPTQSARDVQQTCRAALRPAGMPTRLAEGQMSPF